ncbi:MAG: penicillin-binding protein 2 [Candidatus Omnitrophica bacterium]|nr:penicillin-binding protein 2 [Candidatus Omnitrophota bacterium]
MRTRLFIGACYLGLMGLASGLFYTQVFQGERYRNISEKNRIRLIPLEAPRGRVFDSKKNILVTNRPSFDVVAAPEDISPQIFPLLSKLLKIPESELRRRVKSKREYRFAPAMVEEDIPKELAFQIEERRAELPGIMIRVSSMRYYPYGETASHIIGYIGKINEGEYQKLDRERYGMNSVIGRAGLEKIYDGELRGWRGGKQVEVNAKGEMVKVLREKYPEPGKDLTITIDLEFQKRIMQIIKGDHASVAVLDLDSQNLMAMASRPAFDPNAFVQPGRAKDRAHLLKDEEAPLMDRGISSAYPPGSVFKLVTAIAGLETGKITPNTRFVCNGSFRLNSGSRPFHCWNHQGHGSLNLYEALERSCNVYFYNVASRLSPEDIARYARELGLGEKMKLDATNISPGLVPDSAWKTKKIKAKWYQGETLTFGIGQGYLLTTPLQILRLVSIIAKNGQHVEPRFVVEENPERVEDRVEIREENIKVIKRGMLHVVESPYGTGQLARVDFTQLAAKTGTAQAPPNKAHSWMTGFFPYNAPKIAFVVFVEHGGSGGITAARIVKDMLKVWRDMYAPQMV